MLDTKLVPHSPEAEEGVIGSLLIDGGCLNAVSFLKPSDFFSESARKIYQSCLNLKERSESINQITVATELVRLNWLTEIGGSAYLSHVISQVPTSLDAEYYAQIVQRHAVSRYLIDAASQIAEIGYSQNPDMGLALKNATSVLDAVKKQATLNVLDITTPYQMSEKMLDMLNNRQPKLSWGFTDLDDITTGIYSQDYIVIGARPSVGKTEIMGEVAENIAKTGKKVLFASTEMGINPIIERYIARELKIPIRNLRGHDFVEQYEGQFFKANGDLSNIPVYYLFGNRSSDSIWQNAIKMKEKYGLDIIFVDYLQLLTDCSKGRDNQATRVGIVSHNLKAITKDLDVPIIVASQLNRLVEYRENKRPMLADLRESGDIEQDADVVLLLHRPELYPEDNKETKIDSKGKKYEVPKNPETYKGKLELMMAKHRQLGQAEKPIVLQWLDKNHRYYNATTQNYSEPELI